MNIKPTIGIISLCTLIVIQGFDKAAWQATSQKINKIPIKKIINLVNI